MFALGMNTFVRIYNVLTGCSIMCSLFQFKDFNGHFLESTNIATKDLKSLYLLTTASFSPCFNYHMYTNTMIPELLNSDALCKVQCNVCQLYFRHSEE